VTVPFNCTNVVIKMRQLRPPISLISH